MVLYINILTFSIKTQTKLYTTYSRCAYLANTYYSSIQHECKCFVNNWGDIKMLIILLKHLVHRITVLQYSQRVCKSRVSDLPQKVVSRNVRNHLCFHNLISKRTQYGYLIVIVTSAERLMSTTYYASRFI